VDQFAIGSSNKPNDCHFEHSEDLLFAVTKLTITGTALS
jgi:hypothetical protein